MVTHQPANLFASQWWDKVEPYHLGKINCPLLTPKYLLSCHLPQQAFAPPGYKAANVWARQRQTIYHLQSVSLAQIAGFNLMARMMDANNEE